MFGRSVIAVFVIVILIGCIYTEDVPIAADLKNTPCAPQDYFQIDCNTCYCNMERTGYLCTENSCFEVPSGLPSTTQSSTPEKSLPIPSHGMESIENNNSNDNNISKIPTVLDQSSQIPAESISQIPVSASNVKNTTADIKF